MKVEFIDEKGNTYKTVHPNDGQALAVLARPGLIPYLEIEVNGQQFGIPERHKVRFAETVGQQPVGG